MTLKQRKCQITNCMRLYTPATHNQKYCSPACKKFAKKLRSIQRDLKRDVGHKLRRIDELLGD